MPLSTSVLGASGYAAAELLRLLARHAELAPRWVGTRRAPAHAGDLHPHLASLALETCDFDAAVAAPATVCFSSLPSGAMAAALGRIRAEVVVDLSADFRADEGWIYGLTEHARAELKGALRISNPGCYPTAVLLALIPFARAGLIGGPVIVDAMSGLSGAGREAEDRLLLAGADSSVTAYGGTDHRHVPEMERRLAAFGALETTVSFTPHLVPMARGLLVTARAPLARALEDRDALAVLDAAYALEPFVSAVPEWPATKATLGSNAALVSARVDARNDLLLCSCALDNLGKGAAGQAVQNANIALGLDEREGLDAVGVWP